MIVPHQVVVKPIFTVTRGDRAPADSATLVSFEPARLMVRIVQGGGYR